MGGRAHHAGIGVRANQLQHTCGGPVVQGQLPGAVAAHPNPHSPQQEGHAGHGVLSWRRHRHIVVGLGLRREENREGNVIKGMLGFLDVVCLLRTNVLHELLSKQCRNNTTAWQKQ